MERLREISLDAYDRLIGLELTEVAVDCCITKAPCGAEKAGKSPVDRGKRGLRSARWRWTPRASRLGRRECPRKPPRLAAFAPHPAGSGVRGAGGAARGNERPPRERGYDSLLTRERLEELGLRWEISRKGKPAPFWASRRRVVQRTRTWHNAHKKLVWCTERIGKVIDFWVAFSDVVIIVRRLVREGWSRYRWEGRPSRRP
jgi:hypothetical protein